MITGTPGINKFPVDLRLSGVAQSMYSDCLPRKLRIESYRVGADRKQHQDNVLVCICVSSSASPGGSVYLNHWFTLSCHLIYLRS